jgi:hypothetical protein
MSEEVLVQVEGVSSKFRRSLKRSLGYGVQDIGRQFFGCRARHLAKCLSGRNDVDQVRTDH